MLAAVRRRASFRDVVMTDVTSNAQVRMVPAEKVLILIDKEAIRE
jgi:hypothetical protein